jgi:hypothetical protein
MDAHVEEAADERAEDGDDDRPEMERHAEQAGVGEPPFDEARVHP